VLLCEKHVRPPEPQSDDIGCHVLPHVAESAYLSQFPCRRLPEVAACALWVVSGVVSVHGASRALIRNQNPIRRRRR
jgi:hypothetical protein